MEPQYHLIISMRCHVIIVSCMTKSRTSANDIAKGLHFSAAVSSIIHKIFCPPSQQGMQNDRNPTLLALQYKPREKPAHLQYPSAKLILPVVLIIPARKQ